MEEKAKYYNLGRPLRERSPGGAGAGARVGGASSASTASHESRVSYAPSPSSVLENPASLRRRLVQEQDEEYLASLQRDAVREVGGKEGL